MCKFVLSYSLVHFYISGSVFDQRLHVPLFLLVSFVLASCVTKLVCFSLNILVQYTNNLTLVVNVHIYMILYVQRKSVIDAKVNLPNTNVRCGALRSNANCSLGPKMFYY